MGDILVSTIEKVATKAFQPWGDDASRNEGQQELGSLLSRANTMALMSALSKLTQPDRVPGWLRLHLMDVLTLLPQRPDGVRATLEFVFSVHPSSTLKSSEAGAPQKQGANITMEALKMATQLLSVPPATLSPEQWFPGIAPQLLALLDGKDGPDLVKAAAYVIGFGVLGRKQFGAPGTPGWKAFAEPMLTKINPTLSKQGPTQDSVASTNGSNDVVDLRRETIAVEADELFIALKRLSSLLDSHPNPGLTKRLLAPLMVPLWTISTWSPASKEFDDRYRRPANTLLQIFLKLSGSADKFRVLLGRLLENGNIRISNGNNSTWRYNQMGDSGLQVTYLRDSTGTTGSELDLTLLEPKSDAFIQLLQSVGTNSDISTLFLNLLENSFGSLKANPEIKITLDNEQQIDSVGRVVEAKALQKMMEKLSDHLVSSWKQMLELVNQILAGSQASPANDDAIPVALSLLNIVVTAPGFQKSNAPSDTLASIESSLERISRMQDTEVSQTARNLSLLLKYRDAIDDPSERTTAPTDRQVEDRKTYNLAISYITQADSPPPVRTEGLNLLSSLIRSSSPIIDIQATLVLLSSLLNEDEDYVNLTVIRMFTQLASKHPRSTTKEILDHYVDANERETTDTRLRFGEALLQVIQRLGETFSGDTAKQVGEALLSIAGRRGYRPKTKAKQERAELLEKRKNKAAVDAWQGEVPDLADDDDETEEDKERNEKIAQIVSGWESKRGAEDTRMRASALSIFSVGIETNVAGLGAALVEPAVDLCLNVLTLESGPETGILRRAAIILVLHFVRALADARDHGRRLGFGLPDSSRVDIQRVLEYVAHTDNDGLVREHANDVVESLQNWQLSSLVPPEAVGGGSGSATLTRLAGLDIGINERPSLPPLEPGVRPKIEEIE